MRNLKQIIITLIIIAFISSCTTITVIKKLYSGKPVYEQSRSVIPFELKDQHTIIIGVHINDSKKKYKFIFDTGAVTAISQNATKELGLASSVEIPMMVDVKTYLTEPISLSIGEMKVENFVPLNVDMQKVFGVDLDGFIGSDFLRFFNTTIDYENKRIILEQSEVKRDSNKREYVAEINTPLPERIPTVNMEINGVIKIKGMIDTGSPYSFVFPLSYIDKLDDSLKKQLIKSKGCIITKWPGATSNDNYLLRIKNLKIGKLELKNVPVLFVDLPKRANSVLIGKDFLDNFLIQINYPSDEISFIPYKHLDFNANIFSTGLAVWKDKNNKTVVKGFWETSPTDNNLIKVNDEIIFINGKSTSELSLKEIKSILEDSQIIDIKLEIIKGDKTKIIDLKKKMLFPEIGS